MKKDAKKGRHRKLRLFSWLLFIIYLYIMVHFLFFSEQFGRTPSEMYHYNMQPFAEIGRFWKYRREIGYGSVIVNLVGNVVCFMPLGFVLPVLSSRQWGWIRITLISCLASVLVEGIQLVSKLGSCDVDDVILNTLGGFLGYLLFVICNKIYRMFMDRKA
ncbi:MAG: VanZ family protein [Clostridiaceae bacterium]|nr:VanZ family protein [Clostridiaceae bacterium]